MILYHGTNKTTKDKLLKNGFEHRKYGTYFTNKLSEAERYAECHCTSITYPDGRFIREEAAIITVDTTGWDIVTQDEFSQATGRGWETAIDDKCDKMPDAIHTDLNVGYFMVLNTEKLNKLIQ